MEKMTPIADRVVIEPLEEDSVTASGIVLPDAVKEKPSRGRVLSVGPGAYLHNGTIKPLEIEEGDVVIYSKYGGTEIKLDGRDDLIILREPDILGVVREVEG